MKKKYTLDIFIKSYINDFKLLNYSLQSIRKNIIGYNEIIILIPEGQQREFAASVNIEELNCSVRMVVEYGSGYLFQQVCKMQAYKYSKADYILFSDSDMLFDRKIDLQEVVKKNKPELLITKYFDEKGFNNIGDALCWQYPTQKFFNQRADFEYMRRNALIYHRTTLENLENRFCENQKKVGEEVKIDQGNMSSYFKNVVSIEQYIMSQSSFSEFNVIGHYAYLYEKKRYKFVDTKKWEYEPPLGIQLWSWANKDDKSELHQFEYKRTLDTINKVLDLNLTEL